MPLLDLRDLAPQAPRTPHRGQRIGGFRPDSVRREPRKIAPFGAQVGNIERPLAVEVADPRPCPRGRGARLGSGSWRAANTPVPKTRYSAFSGPIPAFSSRRVTRPLEDAQRLKYLIQPFVNAIESPVHLRLHLVEPTIGLSLHPVHALVHGVQPPVDLVEHGHHRYEQTHQKHIVTDRLPVYIPSCLNPTSPDSLGVAQVFFGFLLVAETLPRGTLAASDRRHSILRPDCRPSRQQGLNSSRALHADALAE